MSILTKQKDFKRSGDVLGWVILSEARLFCYVNCILVIYTENKAHQKLEVAFTLKRNTSSSNIQRGFNIDNPRVIYLVFQLFSVCTLAFSVIRSSYHQMIIDHL